MDMEFNGNNEDKTSGVQTVIDENSPNTKKWKKMVIGVLCILTMFTVWAGYLIVNGSLSFMENPLSANILDDAAILCILWFVGVFIALANRLGILGFGKKSKEEDNNQQTEGDAETIENSKTKEGVLEKYIIPGLTIFLFVPVISAIAIYYIIYFLIFLFVGVLPYLVGIGMIAGLVLSTIRLSKLVYTPKKGRKIMVFSTLMILGYALIIFMMYEFDAKTKNVRPIIDKQEIKAPIANQ